MLFSCAAYVDYSFTAISKIECVIATLFNVLFFDKHTLNRIKIEQVQLGRAVIGIHQSRVTHSSFIDR